MAVPPTVYLHVLFSTHTRTRTLTRLVGPYTRPLYARQPINVRAYGCKHRCSLYCRYVAVLPSTSIIIVIPLAGRNVIHCSCQIHATTENFHGIVRRGKGNNGVREREREESWPQAVRLFRHVTVCGDAASPSFSSFSSSRPASFHFFV